MAGRVRRSRVVEPVPGPAAATTNAFGS